MTAPAPGPGPGQPGASGSESLAPSLARTLTPVLRGSQSPSRGRRAAAVQAWLALQPVGVRRA
jgi:hypothetical protein